MDFQANRCVLLRSCRYLWNQMAQSYPALPFCSSSTDRLMQRSNSVNAQARYRHHASAAGDHFDCSGESCRSCTAVLVADCIALSCCPCAVVSILTLALVKVPWAVSRRCLLSLRRRRVAHVGDADKIRDVAVVGRVANSLEMKKRSRRSGEEEEEEEEAHGRLPPRMEADNRVWMELYQVGNWGFGRVSFSGIQREWRSGKSNLGGGDQSALAGGSPPAMKSLGSCVDGDGLLCEPSL